MQGTTLGTGALGIVLLEQWGIVEFSGFAMLASTLAGISYLVTPYRQAFRAERKVRFWQQLVESRSIVLSEPRFYAFLMLSSLLPHFDLLGKVGADLVCTAAHRWALARGLQHGVWDWLAAHRTHCTQITDPSRLTPHHAACHVIQ